MTIATSTETKKGVFLKKVIIMLLYTNAYHIPLFFGHFRYKIAVYCYKLINLMGSAKFYARTDNASNS